MHFGLLLCVILYTVGLFILGASITAGVFIFHVALVPLMFRYSKTFRRGLIFANFVQWPIFVGFEEPSNYGVEGGHHFTLDYHSRVDHCPVTLGLWHILPKSVHERLKETPPEQREELVQEELWSGRNPIMIYCHGNSNSRAAYHRVELYKFFHNMEFHTIAFDYRGYGDSTKLHPTEDGVVEDALVVYDWVHRMSQKAATQPPIFVWGHSLGTGISAHMLGNLSELSSSYLGHDNPLPYPNGLILEAPFNNLADEVAHHPLSKLVTWLPYYEATFVAPFRTEREHNFRSDMHLSRVRNLPVLILHAKDDVIVPFKVGVKLFRAIQASRSELGAPVKLHAYEKNAGLGHKWICNAQDLSEVIGEFVTSHIGRRR